MKLREKLIHACANHGLGRGWHANATHDQGHATNCIVLGFAALNEVAPNDLTPHSRRLHLAGEELGSVANLQTLVDLGLAVWVEAPGLKRGACYAVQGWSIPSGHFYFLVVRPHRFGHGGPQELWIIEAPRHEGDGYRPTTWDERLGKHKRVRIVELLPDAFRVDPGPS